MLRAKELIRASRSNNTYKSYDARWLHYSQFCSSINIDVFPPTEASIILYLSYFADTFSYSVANISVYAIAAKAKDAGFRNPTKSHAIKCILKTFKKKSGINQNAKQALNPAQLVEVINSCRGVNAFRDACFISIAVFGMLRISEVALLSREDLNFDESHLEITIKKSKTDQVGVGRKVFIQRQQIGLFCAIRILEFYLAQSNIRSGFIFPSPKTSNKNLSISRMRQIFKTIITELGWDSQFFSTHSFRKTGATIAASNNVDRSVIMRHGGWASDAVDLYINSNRTFGSTTTEAIANSLSFLPAS